MNKKNKGLEKFDYKVVLLPYSLTADAKESILDQWGAEGWELKTVSGEQAIFSRLVK